MKIQNFQAEQDQPNWGQSLRNLHKWMGPMWYGYELSTPTQSDMKIVNIIGIGLINPTYRDYIGFVPMPHAHELKSLFTVNMCICSNKTSIQFYWLGGSKNHAQMRLGGCPQLKQPDPNRFGRAPSNEMTRCTWLNEGTREHFTMACVMVHSYQF